MTDRKRINGPLGGTSSPVFVSTLQVARPVRKRKANELRKIFLQTGFIASASGSAYLELETPSRASKPSSFLTSTPTIKLSCSVHGPKPLPRNANFSSNLQLSASIKFAPFATSLRRGYVRDSTERDLGVHLENALKAVIVGDRWPKSALDVAVMVLEGEDDIGSLSTPTGDHGPDGTTSLAHMNILAACVTGAMAALADAKIDCVDLLAGGVAANVIDKQGKIARVLDPCPLEHEVIKSACVVGYLPARDEIVDLWTQGALGSGSGKAQSDFEVLLDSAVGAATAIHSVLREVLIESTVRSANTKDAVGEVAPAKDVEMKL